MCFYIYISELHKPAHILFKCVILIYHRGTEFPAYARRRNENNSKMIFIAERTSRYSREAAAAAAAKKPSAMQENVLRAL